MKRFGLLGQKLGHSLSPIIHNAIFKQIQLDAAYELIECEEAALPHYLNDLKKGNYAGFNVTIPYKKAIMPFLDEIDEKAKQIGSVNTIYIKNGKCCGTNTDYAGFFATIEKNNILVAHQDCYILGTGGASLAINQVLKDLGGNCYFVSRTPKDNQLSYSSLDERKIDILVNTTPVGMYPSCGESPVSKKISSQAKVVMDIIFNPEQTQLLKDAHSNINGLYMLLMQALRSEEIWQNRQIEINEVELLHKLKFYLRLPKKIYSFVKTLDYEEATMGRSLDEVYLFQNQYVLKISKDNLSLKNEQEKTDWLSSRIAGAKSVCYVEENGIGYYLRTSVKGESLASKRFIDHPERLIEAIKQAVEELRKLDKEACPFKSLDSTGTSFVHGDLCLPNIFVDAFGNLSGFIDLANAGLGDPWYDYAWLLWSFEYNLKTNHYNEQLLEALGIQMDEIQYQKYIPVKYIELLKQRRDTL